MGRIAEFIGRRAAPEAADENRPKGFDDFEVRLGDVMRGERATQSKSLLDVQRELKIKASFIAAIENADISAFDSPAVISGFVRSYAKYLGIDADWAFARFCAESGFEPVHGMSQAASGPTRARKVDYAEPLANPKAIFVPQREAFLSRVQPRAIGSVLVLALVAGGLGYGGWSVLQEVQKVRLAPVDQAPSVVAQLDPLTSVTTPSAAPEAQVALPAEADIVAQAPEVMDRLYRPEPLAAPVMVPRDGPIAAINPAQAAAPVAPVEVAAAETPVQTLAPDAPEVEVIAVRPSWVQIKAADGTVIFEQILNPGDRYALPKTEAAPKMRTGESGAIYFAVSGQVYGPAGARGSVTKNIELSPAALTEKYALADMAADTALAEVVNVAQAVVPVAPVSE